MAQTVHLTLEINGEKINGESTFSSMDREDTIECSAFYYGLTAPRDPSTGALTGRRQHEPVVIHKLIDKSTPLLLKALCRNEPVTEAIFRFYRPSLGGEGSEEQFYTMTLENGYISNVNQVSEVNTVEGVQGGPMMEEVSFVFQSFTWRYEIDGATYTDGKTKIPFER